MHGLPVLNLWDLPSEEIQAKEIIEQEIAIWLGDTGVTVQLSGSEDQELRGDLDAAWVPAVNPRE